MDFLKENGNLVIISVYAYVLFFHIKDKDYKSMLLATLITAILICQMKNNVEGLENGDSELLNNDELPDEPEEVFIQPEEVDVKPFELVNRMGPYDGLCLSSIENKVSHELVSNDELRTYLGVQGPLQSVQTDDNVLTGPSLDGETSDNKLAILSNNKASLDCCDSQYSTSTGCVCLTDKQKKYIKSRGFNKSSADLI